MERGVDGNVQVLRDRAAPDEAHEVAVLRRQHEEPGDDLLALADVRHDGAHVVGREPVDDRAVAFAPGEPQHARTQRGDEDRRLLLRP